MPKPMQRCQRPVVSEMSSNYKSVVVDENLRAVLRLFGYNGGFYFHPSMAKAAPVCLCVCVCLCTCAGVSACVFLCQCLQVCIRSSVCLSLSVSFRIYTCTTVRRL